MAEFFQASWGFPASVAFTVAALIHAILYIHVIAVGAMVFIWLERKVSGRIQDRLGPTRTGGKFGWLQTLADGIKLATKEDLMPASADPMLFRISPYLSLAASFAALLALPFAAGWVGQHLNIALFFVLAVLGLEVFGVLLAGYASGSKWSLFGGMRQAAQVVSYEVPIGLCVILPVMICGTMDLVAIAEMQAGALTNWLIFHDPFTFIVFWVFFACALASVNRAPFDLAEAESELVAGFHTEYSGLRWSIFFMAEYGSMFLVSGLAAILFFGGWNGPLPVFDWLGWTYGPGETSVRLTGYLANLAGCTNFILKSVLGVVVMIWVRWSFPRPRIDQVVVMCWKYCVPIAAVCFIGLCGWQVLALPSINNMAAPRMRGEVRERWAQESDHEPVAQHGPVDRGDNRTDDPIATEASEPMQAASEPLGQASTELAGRAG